MERALLAAIQSLLSGILNLDGQPVWIAMWNDQLSKSIKKDEEGEPYYNIQFPAVFLEIVNPERQSIGNGWQLSDFNFNLHILHRQDDAADGTVDQNLDVFDLKESIYQAVYMQWVTDFGQFDYIEEIQDTNHANVYHFVQTFTSNWVDSSMGQPVGGGQTTPPTALDLTGVVIDNNPADFPS